MSLKLFTCHGGHIVLPDRTLVLVGRLDGGNLIVIPPREVWERSELTRAELMQWSFLVAATGKAMLDVLPQLEGGCINYWDAGNWALNDEAEPKGPKTAREYRKVHLHLLGRSRTATNPAWRWGEAPIFPDFAERYSWAAKNDRLLAAECREIVAQVETHLKASYEMPASHIVPWTPCKVCGYPTALELAQADAVCAECQNMQRS
jgi:rubrerythrin